MGALGFGDEKENAHGMVFGERGFAFGHFDGGDTEGPDVGLVVVTGLTDDFGRHPERRTDKRVAS